MRVSRGIGGVLALVVASLLLVPVAGGRQAPRAKRNVSPYHALIRRTIHGIPHIQASSYKGLGYGYGYAFAQDNLCVMAEDYVTVDAERSKFFGPDGSYQQRGNGFSAKNLNSDFFWKQIADSHMVDSLLAKKPPQGPKPEIRDGVRGYVAGYNRYLHDVGGAKGVPDKTCRGKPWVRPITERDAYLRFYQLTLLASGDVAIDGIGEAQPPTPPLGGGALPAGAPAPATTARELAKHLPIGAIGSNAVAIGKGGSRDHRHGVLLGNPHFPWLGTERFY